MMDCLFLPAVAVHDATDGCALYWQPETGEGVALSWPDGIERLVGRPLALVVPMERATALLIELPTQKSRWLRKVLPYAVEEWLADDIESFHLALGQKTADGRYPVRAIARQWLSDWLERLTAEGLQIEAIYLDADLLPEDGRTVLFMPERILVGGGTEERLVVHPAAWSAVQEQLSPFSSLETEHPYRLLAQGQASAIDLAQEEFARTRRHPLLAHAKPLALLLAVWLLLQLGFNLGQAWYYNHQSQQFSAASLALYRELFPADTRIVNLRAQFDDHLQQGSFQESALLSLLEQLSAAIEKSESSSLQVYEIAYSKSRGDLAVQMKAKDFAELDELRQRLADTGLAVQMGSANREEQGVTARLIIGGMQ